MNLQVWHKKNRSSLIPQTNRRPPEKESWKRKKEARNAIPNDPPVITVSCYYANDLHKDTTTVNIAQLTKPSRILIEQDSDPSLPNFKREMLGLPFDEQILFNDARYMHYSRNKKSIIIKDDILYRQNYNDLGEVSHLQVLLPEQLLKVLLQSLHGTAGKHPSISKMMQEFRQKYYFPSIATYFRNWVRDCEICIQNKRINNTNHPRITPLPRMGSWTRKSHANRPIARITAKWGLRKYHYSNRCIFDICICLSGFQPNRSKHSKSHYKHYDKTRLFTHTHYNS